MSSVLEIIIALGIGILMFSILVARNMPYIPITPCIRCGGQSKFVFMTWAGKDLEDTPCFKCEICIATFHKGGVIKWFDKSVTLQS